MLNAVDIARESGDNGATFDLGEYVVEHLADIALRFRVTGAVGISRIGHKGEHPLLT